MKRSLRFIVSGALAMVIMLGISFAIEDPAQAHSTRITGIIIGVVIATVPIYDIERWTLLRRTVVHVLVMLVTVLPCLVVSGWFDVHTAVGVLALIGTFIGFGIAGWVIGFAIASLVSKYGKNASSDRP